ncbi:MAG: DUF983 domain-containing protein [Azospirillum sp.]|nr:DUF983 domain-containing protein [Azospirillum sp.]
METSIPEQSAAVRRFGGTGPRVLTAGLRGWRGRCPRCGGRGLFTGYLTVAEQCPGCSLALADFRVDDAPPYVTIFIVGHLIVPAMLLLEMGLHPPEWLHISLWVPLTLAATLALLPRVKGALIGIQWSLGLTG